MAASNAEHSIPLWAKVLYFFVAAVITIAAYVYGSIWVGHIVLILALFVATWLVEPGARPALRILITLFAMTLLLATVLALVLSALGQLEAIEENQVLSTLLDTPGVIALLSFMVAGIISAVFLVAALLLAIEISSHWILAMHEVYGVTRQEARRLLRSVLLNIGYPFYLIENGKITQTKPKGLLPKLGGPGFALIKPYNAVVFEQGGKVTRIEGPGKVVTARSEFPKAIVDLRSQWEDFSAENVLTKDNVPLTLHCGVGFRIESRADTARRAPAQNSTPEGGRFAGVIGGDYPVYESTLYRAAYGTTAAGWQLTSRGAAESILRQVVRRYLLEDLYRLDKGNLSQDESVLDSIIKETHRRVNEISPAWGATITTFALKSLEAPSDIREKLVSLWAERYETERKKLVSDAAWYGITKKGEAEAQAIKDIEEAKLGAREDLMDVLLDRFLVGQPQSPKLVVRLVTALEVLSSALSSDTTTATRYIEALEKMASEAGTKVLIVGDEHHLLPPLLDSDR